MKSVRKFAGSQKFTPPPPRDFSSKSVFFPVEISQQLTESEEFRRKKGRYPSGYEGSALSSPVLIRVLKVVRVGWVGWVGGVGGVGGVNPPT